MGMGSSCVVYRRGCNTGRHRGACQGGQETAEASGQEGRCRQEEGWAGRRGGARDGNPRGRSGGGAQGPHLLPRGSHLSQAVLLKGAAPLPCSVLLCTYVLPCEHRSLTDAGAVVMLASQHSSHASSGRSPGHSPGRSHLSAVSSLRTWIIVVSTSRLWSYSYNLIVRCTEPYKGGG